MPTAFASTPAIFPRIVYFAHLPNILKKLKAPHLTYNVNSFKSEAKNIRPPVDHHKTSCGGGNGIFSYLILFEKYCEIHGSTHTCLEKKISEREHCNVNNCTNNKGLFFSVQEILFFFSFSNARFSVKLCALTAEEILRKNCFFFCFISFIFSSSGLSFLLFFSGPSHGISPGRRGRGFSTFSSFFCINCICQSIGRRLSIFMPFQCCACGSCRTS